MNTNIKTLSFKKAKELLCKTQKTHIDFIKNSRKATSLSPLKIKVEKNNPSNSQQNSHPKIKEKTLVIDLDETLVHSSFDYFDSPDIILPVEFEGEKSDVYVSVRPGAKEFISELSKYYQIVIFTASMSKYAEPLMSILDEKKSVSYHLFREHCTLQEGSYIKDLSQMGKELRNIVLIDNSIVSFAFQQENGIPIKSWYDDYTDIELFKFIPILKNLSGFYDIRTEIPKFVKNNTFIWMKAIKWLRENLLNINYQIDLDQVLRLEKNSMTIANPGSKKDNHDTIGIEKTFHPRPKNKLHSTDGLNHTTTNVSFTCPANNNNGNHNGNNLLRKSHFTKQSHSNKHSNCNSQSNNPNNSNTHNQTNDFIKITNNFFYDKNPSKIQEDDTYYQCERILTEIEPDNPLEEDCTDNIPNLNTNISIHNENDINLLHRSSSLNKKRPWRKGDGLTKKSFLSSMKGLMHKKDSQKNLLHTSIEEKPQITTSNLYDIFKKFPKLNTFVKPKNKNRSSIETISTPFPHQKIINSHLHHQLNKGGAFTNLKKTPPHHYPSCSINIQLQKPVNKTNNINNPHI